MKKVGGNVSERGRSFGIAHVLSFKTWQVFVAVYKNEAYQDLPVPERVKLLKDIYVFALLNQCSETNKGKVAQPRRGCGKR